MFHVKHAGTTRSRIATTADAPFAFQDTETHDRRHIHKVVADNQWEPRAAMESRH